MASRSLGSDGHLDATGDREVVYCHACANEWYRDQHGLACPDCQSEATEIVSADNDPRDFDEHHTSASTSPEIPTRGYLDDSDPDEADIEEHMRGDHGFTYNRSTRTGADQRHHNPEMEPVLNRFFDMVNGFGPLAAGGGPPHTHNDLHDDHMDEFDMSPHMRQHSQQHQTHHQAAAFGQPRVHTTTFRRGPFGSGTASVTIFSGPVRTRGNLPHVEGQGDPFQQIFSSVLRDMGPPEGDHQGGGAGAQNPAAFIRSLQDIMGFLNPANAMAGDAVYSQEALDRIISNLMEANPQSNAAPPATEDALKNLERKPVSKEMLAHEDKTECSICIDDINEGDTALFLPCKHWFHEQCVVLWLKEHNTCPICRTPIEKNERGNNNNSGSGSASGTPSGAAGAAPPGAFPDSGSSGSGQNHYQNWFSAGPHHGRAPGAGDGSENERYQGLFGSATNPRPPSHRHTRLNEAIRSVSSMQERQRERTREQGTSSSVSYDTSRLQRRSSMSPTSARAAPASEYAARMRERSPSQSGRQWAESDRESAQQDALQRETSRRPSTHNPLSWLRDRFSGGGSNNSSRDGAPS